MVTSIPSASIPPATFTVVTQGIYRCLGFEGGASSILPCPLGLEIKEMNSAMPSFYPMPRKYVINVISQTQIVDRNRVRINLTDIEVGDNLNIYGFQELKAGVITALVIRDLSKPARPATGTLQVVVSDADTACLQTSTQTPTLSDSSGGQPTTQDIRPIPCGVIYNAKVEVYRGVILIGTGTTERGMAVFENLKPGEYTVVASAPGYERGKDTTQVYPGETNTLTIMLPESKPPTSGGYIYVEPLSATIKVNEELGDFQVYYQPPMPVCSPGAYCVQVMPRPVPVEPEKIVSSNTNVADIILRDKFYIVGRSAGETKITFTYKNLSAVMKVKVVGETIPSITVLSPNGGERWAKGSTQIIKWTSTGIGPEVIISLVSVDSNIGTRALSNVVNNGSYSWTIPNCYSGRECSSNFDIPIGSYKIQIYGFEIIDAGVDDFSDAPFSIISSTGNLPPVISGVSGPTTLQVGQTGTWTVKASDPENGTLSYSVIWGDEPVYASAPQKTSPANIQTVTFTHSYATAGTYNPTFTVTDNQNQSAKTSISVNVGGNY